jgi:hypothetical protein
MPPPFPSGSPSSSFSQDRRCFARYCRKTRSQSIRWRERSRFFPGIASAMADQWGDPTKFQPHQADLFEATS